ncbi:hypothetical protein HanIR_Chr05g0234051 [Helianthus annuus]|nr:hypothetical protein HanIR_Chr05g0234051 [Helianthus annuus]
MLVVAGNGVTLIGAVQAVSREAWETGSGSIEGLVKVTGKESIQWGLAAGMYSGLTYGLKEARGVHDWKKKLRHGFGCGSSSTGRDDDVVAERV